MSSVLGYPPLQAQQLPETIPSADESVRRQVWGVLTGLYPRGRTPERRAVQRFPYPQLLYLTPVDDDNLPVGESVAVIGKHLSERGLGFFHRAALALPPHDRVARIARIRLGRILDRHHLVSVQPVRLVRQRRALHADRALAHRRQRRLTAAPP